MAPKTQAERKVSLRKRTKSQAELDDVPAEEPTVEVPVDSIVPYVAVKIEETEPVIEETMAEENAAGRHNATKGNGMNPLEVSRMLTMLNKRRKKDRACLRIRNTNVFAYLVFNFISIHISTYVCLCCTCMEIS